MQSLGNLPGGGFGSQAYGVSADGKTVVGNGAGASGWEAFRWTKDGGMQGLGDLPSGGFLSAAYGVSADGKNVVGKGWSTSGINEAFRWTEGGTMQGLGDLPGGSFNSYASDVSADGKTVVGQGTGASGTEAFLWSEGGTMRSFKELLQDDYGLNLSGWTLGSATGISDDGLTIVGNGTNPSGQTEAWLARLGDPGPVIPSPPTTETLNLLASNTRPTFEFLASSDFDPTKPTVVLTHGIQPTGMYQQGPPSTFATMKAEIENLLGKSVNVLLHHWEEAYYDSSLPAAGDVVIGFQKAIPYLQSQGSALASEIIAKLGDTYDQAIHFIGHSAGTLVNAFAAEFLSDNSDINVSQFTILEAPLDHPKYSEQTFHDKLKDHPEVTWVDNYRGNTFPSTGEPVAGAYNVEWPTNHHGMDDYYANTINSKTEGFWYSAVNPDGGFSSRPDPEYWQTPKPLFTWRNIDDLSDEDWQQLEGTPCISIFFNCLREQSPSSIGAYVEIPEDAETLAFDFLFSELGDGDWLTLFFNDTLLYSFLGSNFLGNELIHAEVPLGDLPGQSGWLAFRLNSVGERNAEVMLDNLVFQRSYAVPEPGTLALLLLGMILLAFGRARPIRRIGEG